MIQVKLTTNFPSWPLLRQTPGSRGVWGDCRFRVNEDEVEACDYWVVYEGLPKAAHTRCPAENVILVTGEPPSIKSYTRGYLEQFATVVTCHPGIAGPRVIRSQQAQPWHIGVIAGGGSPGSDVGDYDALSSRARFAKTKTISVVCSSKAITEGHRRRLRFVEALRSHFGSRLDVFGRGFREVEDKAVALLPYEYHVAVENESLDDYWTEKLADAYLADAFPFHYGCPNLASYFPAESFAAIDIGDPEASIAVIEVAIAGGLRSQRREALDAARRLVLDEHNLFALLARLCLPVSGLARESVALEPEAYFTRASWPGRVARRLAAAARRRLSRGTPSAR